MFREKIKKALQKATGLEMVQVDVPVQEAFGDYSTNIVMTMFSKDKKGNAKNPKESAENLKSKLEQDSSLMQYFEKVEIAGPGFLNFWIKEEALVQKMQELLENPKSQISNPKKGKVVVEYSSPNIAKPFTIGHFPSTVIGDAIANLMEATSWQVYRDNHLGDWGTQFGKQIYAIKIWGNEEELDKSEHPVKELVALYVKFHEVAEKDPTIEEEGRKWFKKLEGGDPEARRLWQKCIDWSFKEFKEIYDILGIKHTENGGRGYGESFVEDKMQDVVHELEEKGLLKEGKEGAKLVFFPQDKYPPLMILKKDGASLYATRDLAMDKWRLLHYGKDVLVINEVGMEQTLYWQQVFETEYMLGWYKPGQRIHIKHGHFRFKDKKMSTRKGNVIWLRDVLQEATDRAKKLAEKSGGKEKDIEKIARQVGVGALKWNELKRDFLKDIVFDWNEILNMEGNSGPYLQYTYARTQSVLEKSKLALQGETLRGWNGLELNEEELSVLRMLPRFSEVVEDAAETYSPNILCNYLYELAQKFNTFYNKHRILEAEGASKQLRLALTQATGTVLKNGLYLLGIEAPEKM